MTGPLAPVAGGLAVATYAALVLGLLGAPLFGGRLARASLALALTLGVLTVGAIALGLSLPAEVVAP